MSAPPTSSGRTPKPPRPRVLLAEDDASFRASLEDALAGEPYELLLAGDGLEAKRLLDEHDIDLVVTDVQMPEVDGLTLVAELSRRPRVVPCIVMTAFATPELDGKLRRLGILSVIDKPLEIAELRQRIREGLAQSAGVSVVRGLPATSFLQLLGLERKTCTVRLQRDGAFGLLFFSQGELLDATLDDLSGMDAALELVTWQHAEITLQDHCPIRQRRIEVRLENLLLEAMRIEDERERHAVEVTHSTERTGSMSLEAHLQDFRDIKGYLASGIMDFTGETLATDSVQANVDLEATGAVFNDIFRGAHEASKKIGLEACQTMTLATPKGLVVMECSGIDAASHLHFIVVLTVDGNQALARKTLEKVVPRVVADMS